MGEQLELTEAVKSQRTRRCQPANIKRQNNIRKESIKMKPETQQQTKTIKNR